MRIVRESIPEKLKEDLKQYVYSIIGVVHAVYKELDNGLPEYIYQEALYNALKDAGYDVIKECTCHPIFKGKQLQSFVKMDLVVQKPRGNIIIECKSISELTEKERFQTYGYLTATHFPIALLVNFGSFPKAQVERYYAHDNKIHAF